MLFVVSLCRKNRQWLRRVLSSSVIWWELMMFLTSLITCSTSYHSRCFWLLLCKVDEDLASEFSELFLSLSNISWEQKLNYNNVLVRDQAFACPVLCLVVGCAAEFRHQPRGKSQELSATGLICSSGWAVISSAPYSSFTFNSVLIM